LASPEIVVWAFDLELADVAMTDREDEHGRARRARGFVEVVTTPYANNRNLAAQRGIHLLYRPIKVPKAKSPMRREALDGVLQHAHAMVAGPLTALCKFQLPAREAGRLLELLSKHGATGATVFPGFDGVARAMWERRQWRREFA